jgi:DNA polymerase-3 subunit alpha
MGIAVDPPDINRSEEYFTVEKGRIISGFDSVGIGGIGAGAIVSGREKGPYRDFPDFFLRTDRKFIGKREIEILIDSGILDSFGVSRESLGKIFEEKYNGDPAWQEWERRMREARGGH